MPYNTRSGEQCTYLSFLPLAHVFERAIEHGAYKRGWMIIYACGDIAQLCEDFKLAKPTVIIAVPKVFNKIHAEFRKKLSARPIFE